MARELSTAPPATDRPAPLRIGISARLMHQPPAELGFRGKTLQYLEQSIAHWILAEGALCFMLPTLESEGSLRRAAVHVGDYVRAIDALVLQGGADVSPRSYGEEALRPEWEGDRIRDQYELDLIWECIIQKKPVLGICRGCQLLNVAFGGTLYQDVGQQVAGAGQHVDHDAYDLHTHAIRFTPGSLLERLYPFEDAPRVTSIHHQAIRRLGNGVLVDALSTDEIIVEAMRWTGNSFVYGVQWHPQFHPPERKHLLDSGPHLAEFLRQARRRRDGSR
ncbi:gamma-glutamyl-gamma-aminobutyrate hydrolase family protein [Viridibacterium curvum]|uniref:Gamma-glutamyl-gamma-aminobutyrate hydrolase family protein n=1 Tax=Viridibacterium curvum TaxID=1101404 RepID=A0ABP9R2M4_9RHOO